MEGLSVFENFSYKNIYECLLRTAKRFDISSIEVAQEMGEEFYSKFKSEIVLRFSEPVKPKKSEALKWLSQMNILVTGAREGETLVGIYSFNNGVVLKIVKGLVRPYSGFINELRYEKNIWERFLKKLGSLPFFESLSIKERELYLLEMQTDKKYSQISDIDLKIKVLQLGKGKLNKFLTLPSDIIEKIMSPEAVYTAQEIRDMFPQVPGSKGKTLVFYSKGLRVSTDYHEVENYKGLSYDVRSGKLLTRTTGKTLVVNYIGEDHRKLGFRIPEDQYVLSKENVFEVVLERFPQFRVNDIAEIENSCKTFTTAAYKSLIQKTIRFRPKRVNISLYGENTYPSDFFISVILALTIVNPGSFVPSIQRYVSGLESGSKRLFVTIVEDSYLEDNLKLVGLLSSALLVQRVSSWVPSRAMILSWIDMAVKAYKERRYYDWDISRGSEIEPYTLSKKLTSFQSCSFLIDEIKSLKSDYGMVRDIAANEGRCISPRFRFVTPEIMNISHCVDFHWAPEFVYFFEQSVVNTYLDSTVSSEPFHNLFTEIFRSVTGFNPRKTPLEQMKNTKLIIDTRNAQKLLLLSREPRYNEKSFESHNSYKFKVEIEDSWIAGMMGSIEVKLKGSPTVLVTLLPRDIYQFVVIKKPSRGMKDATVPVDLEFKAKEYVRNLLRSKGIPLNKTNPPIPELKQAVLYLKDEEYYLKIKGKLQPWKGMKKVKVNIPLVDRKIGDLKSNLINSLYKEYVLKGWKNLILSVILEYDKKVLMRLLTFASKYTKEFELPRISRDGGATKQAVFANDVSVYQLLLKLTNIVPAAISRKEGNTLIFTINNSPMWWKVRDLIELELSRKQVESGGRWIKIEEQLGRNPWKHQIEALEEMKRRNKRGKKGNFLHLTVGLGKTFIVMNFLKYLQSSGKLPMYIIYTLPTSAMKSIFHEVEAFGFEPELLMPIQSVKGDHPYSKYIYKSNVPKPYTFTLISHDHLRRCKDELMNISNETIFIIDEVHKALNETIRTSVALSLSKLSKDFIALTGTPIIDNHTYKLIWWLSQIVSFEVNENNFWVAANGMVSRKINTGVLTETVRIEAPLDKKEQRRYINLVSRAIGGRNPNPSFEELFEATNICYKASTRKIIKRILYHIKERGVMVVAHNKSHQEEILELLLEKGVKREDVFLINKDNTLFFTDEMVESKKVPDYKVVITTLRQSEGYTLTRLSIMITGVYPSNNANREQLEGRINRIGQRSKTVTYEIIHTGILTYIMQKHAEAKSLSDVLKTLAIDVN